MSLSELLPSIHALPREDKVQLTHLLVNELAQTISETTIEGRQAYEIWSPYDSFDAAKLLMDYVEQSRKGV